MRTLTLLAISSIALVAGSCAGDAPDSEDVGEAQSAINWSPSAALVGRLQVLGQLPTTEHEIAKLAYFKAASPGPSMSIALVLRDGPFYTQGFGTVGAGEPTADTAYYIASSTKVFTAAAMLNLIEGVPSMHLDDPVSKYYAPAATVAYPGPGTPAACPPPCATSSAPMTLRHLITHASGLPNYGSTYPSGTNTQEPTRAQFDAMVAASSLEFYPGYNRDYSGVGISVAGRVIENVSGETYATFLTNQILAPLGMTHSAIDPTTLPSGTVIAQAYNDVSNPPGSGQDVQYQLIAPGDLANVTALAPAGHLVTTAGDLSKFLAMQIGATTPSQPLTPADVTLSHQELIPGLQEPSASDPRTVGPCSNGGYFIACQECGAGWWYGNQAVELGGHGDSILGNWVDAAGGSAGYGSLMYVAPDAGVAAAVLSTANPDGSSNPHDGYNGEAINDLAYEAATALNNPSVPWTAQPLPSALEGFMALLNDGVPSSQMAQTFSQTFINLNGSGFAANLSMLQANLGLCSSFTVQRINSTYSATVTLQCANTTLPMTFTSTTAAPYLMTNFTILPRTAPAVPAGVPGGHAALALMGISGNNIPTAVSNGDGTWTATDLGETSGDPWLQLDSRTAGTTALQGDFDCDGRVDVAVTGGSGWNTIPIAFSNGDGSYHGTNLGVTSGFTLFPTCAAQAGAKAVAGDFDGDGYADVALTCGTGWNTIPVAFSNGDGTFHGTNLAATGIAFATYAQQAGVKPVFGDFDGDGRGDIALVGYAGWGQIPIAYSNGDGTFHAAWATVSSSFLNSSAQAGVSAVAGDFDGNGKWDIALTGGSGWSTIPVAFSNGNGTFTATSSGETSGDTGFPIYATQSNARPVFGDFDGDGNFDIALTGGINWNTIPIAFSNGNGTFHGTNMGVSGYTQFTSTAQTTALKPVGL